MVLQEASFTLHTNGLDACDPLPVVRRIGGEVDIAGFRLKVALDLLYLQNCCLVNDLKILFRTVRVVLAGKGAL
ncbi:hypothetical protein LBMAG52_23570 [Planctomycetia bacterium]|nr:hypothetical protein LBMAG52_23570 [Planctomycetia bacterium]